MKHLKKATVLAMALTLALTMLGCAGAPESEPDEQAPDGQVEQDTEQTPQDGAAAAGDDLPEDVDSENLPEGVDPENRPAGAGADAGMRPEGLDTENLPEGIDPENLPEGFEPGEGRPQAEDGTADDSMAEEGTNDAPVAPSTPDGAGAQADIEQTSANIDANQTDETMLFGIITERDDHVVTLDVRTLDQSGDYIANGQMSTLSLPIELAIGGGDYRVLDVGMGVRVVYDAQGEITDVRIVDLD